MGGLFSLSRISRAGVTNSAGESNSQGLYRYPPPNGKGYKFETRENENITPCSLLLNVDEGGLYFSNHYYLGHRKFDTGEPEVFLFGDLQDLNYFPSKPVKVAITTVWCMSAQFPVNILYLIFGAGEEMGLVFLIYATCSVCL